MLKQIERMTITLPRDMAAVVKRAVKEGGYVSSSEVIREALRGWKAHLDAISPPLSRKKKNKIQIPFAAKTSFGTCTQIGW